MQWTSVFSIFAVDVSGFVVPGSCLGSYIDRLALSALLPYIVVGIAAFVYVVIAVARTPAVASLKHGLAAALPLRARAVRRHLEACRVCRMTLHRMAIPTTRRCIQEGRRTEGCGWLVPGELELRTRASKACRASRVLVR